MQTPKTLVLGGGGVLGEAWMNSVLAGIELADGFDARGCDCYVGTSAGSIVAASLAAGIPPRERLGASVEGAVLSEEPPGERSPLRQALGHAGGLASTFTGPLASLALTSTAAGGALLRRSLLRGVSPGSRSLAQLGRLVELAALEWDGRLRIAAVDAGSGRRVAFGAPGAPAVSVAEAVQASCAIPGYFRPVEVDGHSYVDGGVWSPTNLDLAVAGRGERVLCLNPTGSLRPSLGAPAGAIGPLSRAIAATEAQAVKARGARVRIVNPDEASAAAMGVNLMDPRGRQRVIAAGLAQGRRLGARSALRAA